MFGKSLKTAFLLSSLVMLLSGAAAFAEDNYDKLAKELTEVEKSTTQAKIAIIPFSYLDKRKSDGGAIVSERLTTRIGKMKKFQVIERSLLENVLQEQHLEASGLVDAETAKQIGKVLGVEAIINGTLLDIGGGMVEVNARLIKTETAEVMTTASVQVKKIWTDVSVAQASQPQAAQPQAAQPPAEEPVQEEPAAPVYKAPAKKVNGYFDIFFLASSNAKMDLSFSNTRRRIYEEELDFDLNDYRYKTVKFTGMTAESSMPIGMRFVGYGKHWGFGWELSYMETTLKKQETKVQLDNYTGVDFEFYNDGYIKMTSLNFLSGDLLFRFSDGIVQPYFGIGFGLTLNTVTSDHITVSRGKLSAMGIGFLARFPILGLRINAGENTSFFGEMRTLTNGMSFDRDIVDEKDELTVQATQILVGIGFKM
ncbi:MAG: FlgO family outer membrane protein [Elusimicrobiota bacterium]